MEFEKFEQYYGRKSYTNKFRDDFIKMGYEKFLFLPDKEERESTKIIKPQIDKIKKKVKIPVEIESISKLISDYLAGDYYPFFICFNDNKPSHLASKISLHSDKKILLPNLFQDDPTENYLILFKKKNIEKALLFLNVIRPYVPSEEFPAAYAIYGLDINFIVNTVQWNGMVAKFPKPNNMVHFYGDSTRKDNNPNMIIKARQAIDHIMSFDVFNSELEMAFLLRETIMTLIQQSFDTLDFLKESQLVKRDGKVVAHFQELDLLYSDMVANKEVSIKWKNEVKLFQQLKKLFPDAIYQYQPTWLLPQSIDIYIPSINLAIEYQGIQHYEPVEVFGGERSFVNQLEQDKRKRLLCEQNNVDLLEWSYQTPISLGNINHLIIKKGTNVR